MNFSQNKYQSLIQMIIKYKYIIKNKIKSSFKSINI
jgi:hypothetical protein